ncbi:hypothetical protein TGME49_269588 [Toxoplasma gondii ME49]|uniref:Uncharacterized protein n=1 Tax=Toxoplasma gondii (strain ATCC 50611 / Me49) TaxID=508771 RepID=S8F4G8_TOXGM|nr:hypothetical protein TGME49_269588 [Toxoplasma gondii ME49]EPT28343.1 hypothetical protein TGME49_269588 [Toxoplasma gondii ME49]|eukprot:XP_018636586.1 hypothetical protein TGME49_269588 [Toxoplasma gondii ME49]
MRRARGPSGEAGNKAGKGVCMNRWGSSGNRRSGLSGTSQRDFSLRLSLSDLHSCSSTASSGGPPSSSCKREDAEKTRSSIETWNYLTIYEQLDQWAELDSSHRHTGSFVAGASRALTCLVPALPPECSQLPSSRRWLLSLTRTPCLKKFSAEKKNTRPLWGETPSRVSTAVTGTQTCLFVFPFVWMWRERLTCTHT